MNEADGSIPVAVVGAGRMGAHHARTYGELPSSRLVGVVDTNHERATGLTQQYGGVAFTSPEALLEAHEDLAAVSIAAPTPQHAVIAKPFLERQIACLIEKPLAPTLDQARLIRDLARRHQALVQVGHIERFNPAVRAAVALDFPARFLEIERISPMPFRALDVGVVMDMMIHDLDIALMFADSPIERIEATGVAVVGQHEDIANARIVFESGCVANLTASRLALKTQRRLHLFSEAGYISLDYRQRRGWALTSHDHQDALATVRAQLARGEDLSQTRYQDLVHVRPLQMPTDHFAQDPLTAQLSSFLKAVLGNTPPTVSVEAGFAAVETAQRIIEQLQAHHWQNLLDRGA